MAECDSNEACVNGICTPRTDGGHQPDAAASDTSPLDGLVADTLTFDASAADVDPVDVRIADAAMDSGPMMDAGCVGATCPGIPEHLWSDTLNGPPDARGSVRSIVADNMGAVIFIGKNSGTLNLGGRVVTTHGLGDVLMAKFSGAGVYMWAHSFGSVEEESGRGIDVDGSDNIYITGLIRGPTSLGGAVLPHAVGDGPNLFVASYTSAGAHRWSHTYPGLGTDTGNTVQVSGDNVYVSGIFNETVTTPVGTLVSAGSRDAFVMHFDRDGVLDWQRRYGGPAGEFTLGAVASPTSTSLYVAGTFLETSTFGLLGSRTAAGVQDLFVMEVSARGAEVQVQTFGAPGASMYGHNMAADARGV